MHTFWPNNVEGWWWPCHNDGYYTACWLLVYGDWRAINESQVAAVTLSFECHFPFGYQLIMMNRKSKNVIYLIF